MYSPLRLVVKQLAELVLIRKIQSCLFTALLFKFLSDAL